MTDSSKFDSLQLKPELLSNLADLEYFEMTLVQARSLPLVLEGVDVLARAKTGSGKTAAFGLGVLNQLDAAVFRLQSLILCPTRELADQVSKEMRRLARAIPNIKIMSVCGGMPLRAQTASLRRSPHIVVGTPGRVHKHLRDGNIDLAALRVLVLDEADRMLDMGFTDEINAILSYAPKRRQTLLFSATYPDAIAEISAQVQHEPKVIDVTGDEQPAQINQSWCSVIHEERAAALLRALRAWGGQLNLVFCNTKIDCAYLGEFLRREGVVAVALHGDLDQADRNRVLVQFSNRSASVMIATDVAARGIDVSDIDAVFNYELPQQPDVYVHRIGRTARAGKTGTAVSLVAEREMRRLLEIEKVLPDANIQSRRIPDGKQGDDKLRPLMATIHVSGGRKNKLRPGDLLGALTAKGGIPGRAVGSIDLFDNYGYVAVESQYASRAQQQLGGRPIKGRKYRARLRK